MRVLVLILLMAGCSTTPLTEDEEFARDYKRATNIENWETCLRAYKQMDKPTWHKDHQHGKHKPIRHWMIKSDLRVNQCRLILGEEYWID